jgi:lysophospholipase L1-like esterase
MYWVLILVCLVAGAVLMEYAARAFLRRSKYYVFEPNKQLYIEPDPDILPTLEKKIFYATNEVGERGNQLPQGQRFYKILCCGGSAMEGMFLDQKTCLSGALESRLSGSDDFVGQAVNVGNIGKSLTDMVTLNQMLRKLLPQYDNVDVMVVMVGASEVVRWLELGAPTTTAPECKPVSDMFALHPEMQYSFSVQNLALRKLLGRLLPRKPQTFKRAGRRYREAREMRATAVKTITQVPDSRSFMEHFSGELRKGLALAQAKAPLVVVVRQPWFEKEEYSAEELSQFWHGGVGNAFYGSVTEFYSPQVISALMHQVSVEVEKVCSEFGITSIDCRKTLPSRLEFFYDQIHFTASGSQLLADEIAATISRIRRS